MRRGGPVSAAAGVACLEIVRDPAVQQRANATAAALRNGLEETMARRGLDGKVSGELSLLGIDLKSERLDRTALAHRLKGAMLLNGVDLSGTRLIVSSVHSAEDVEWTLEAFDRALSMLQAEGV